MYNTAAGVRKAIAFCTSAAPFNLTNIHIYQHARLPGKCRIPSKFSIVYFLKNILFYNVRNRTVTQSPPSSEALTKSPYSSPNTSFSL